MRYRDLPQFPRATHEETVFFRSIERFLAQDDVPILLEPDYQRGHVWTEAQQIAYVEYKLMGGEAAGVIISNCSGWMRGYTGPYELVDGLQRVTAVRAFVGNKIKVFGRYAREFTDKIPDEAHFRWRVLALPTRAEVLKLYLLLNSGGVVHSPDEIARVKALLEKEHG